LSHINNKRTQPENQVRNGTRFLLLSISICSVT